MTFSCATIILLMREDMPNVYPAQIISHIHDKPILIPANVENSAPFSKKTGSGKILSYFVRTSIALKFHDGKPGSQWPFSIGMILPECL